MKNSPISIAYNSKIACAGFSLNPQATCKGRPCYAACYALRSGVLGKDDQPGPYAHSALPAWDRNMAAIEAAYSRPSLAASIVETVIKAGRRTGYFRWMVAGDVPEGLPGVTMEFVIIETARHAPDVRFLLFTKNHRATRDIRYKMNAFELKNLSIIISEWPGVTSGPGAPAPHGFRAARVSRAPIARGAEMECPGACEACRACWRTAGPDAEKDIVFRPHGNGAAAVE